MEYEFDDMIVINQLELEYEAHVVGFDGENFTYGIYFDDEISELHCENVKKAVYSLGDSDDEESEDYIGYIDISKKEDKIFVFQDLGGSFDCEEKVHKLLNALNSVEGISKVLINE